MEWNGDGTVTASHTQPTVIFCCRTQFNCGPTSNCCPITVPVCEGTTCTPTTHPPSLLWHSLLSDHAPIVGTLMRPDLCRAVPHWVNFAHSWCTGWQRCHSCERFDYAAPIKTFHRNLPRLTAISLPPAVPPTPGVASCVYPRVRDVRHGFDDQCISLAQGCGDNCTECSQSGACLRCQSVPLYRLEGSRYATPRPHLAARDRILALFFGLVTAVGG